MGRSKSAIAWALAPGRGLGPVCLPRRGEGCVPLDAGMTAILIAGQCTPHFLFGLAEKKTGRARSKRKERFWQQLCTCVQSCCTGVCVSVPAPILPGLRARYGLLRGRYCRPVAEGAEGVGVVIALICFSFRCRWLSRTGAGKAPGRPVGAVINRPVSSCALPGRGTAKAAERSSAAFVFVFF